MQVQCHRGALIALDRDAAAPDYQPCPGAEQPPAFIAQQGFDPAGARQEKVDRAHIALRRFAGAIFRASRYLATVRRAT